MSNFKKGFLRGIYTIAGGAAVSLFAGGVLQGLGYVDEDFSEGSLIVGSATFMSFVACFWGALSIVHTGSNKDKAVNAGVALAGGIGLIAMGLYNAPVFDMPFALT